MRSRDSISWDWSVSGGGSIEKNARGYGVFTAPEDGTTVTIKVTFSDGADTGDGDGIRDDSDHAEEYEVKVVGVESLEPDGDADFIETIDTATAGTSVLSVNLRTFNQQSPRDGRWVGPERAQRAEIPSTATLGA